MTWEARPTIDQTRLGHPWGIAAIQERMLMERELSCVANDPVYPGMVLKREFPNPPAKIGLIGKMHSGKTSMSDAIVRQGYRRMAFADPVKDIACLVCDIIQSEVNRRLGEPWSLTTRRDIDAGKSLYRGLLQWIGADYGRNYLGETTWIDLFALAYAEHPGGKIIVDDLRYANEAEYLRKQGFMLFRVIRDEDARRQSVRDSFERQRGYSPTKKELKVIMGHESESDLDEVRADYNVLNNGTTKNLEVTARWIVGARDGT